MAVSGSPPERRRPRRGSVERPVNGRLYRGAWLVVLLPLAAAALSVTRPSVLPAPPLPPVFDKAHALSVAQGLARLYPDRSPGGAGDRDAAAWVARQFAALGLPTTTATWRAELPGGRHATLRNVVAVARGRSPQTLVLLAHHDDDGDGPGGNDNASGVATLLELARGYGRPAAGQPAVTPAHTIVFASTDGAVAGAAGAARFARSRYARDAVAVLNLDALAGHGPARLQIASDTPASPAALVPATAAARLATQLGSRPDRPSVLAQLVDLGFPYSLYEQAPFVGRGSSAITITTGTARPPDARPALLPERLDGTRLGQLGAGTQSLLESLDQGLELGGGTPSYLFLDTRIVHGWAIELLLIAALVPFAAAVVDLFARCRRRRIALAPAWRSLRSRVALWLFVALAFELFRALGFWPAAPGRPLWPATHVAGHWPRLPLVVLALLGVAGWLVARQRLAPRRRVASEEELAGQTVALIALGVVAVLVAVMNPFALLFVLPSLHLWLWLPQARASAAPARAALLLGGCAGLALLLASFAVRFGLGLDAPWYLLALAASGYVGIGPVLVAACWAAVGAQLAALLSGRYAPYPRASERGRGPVRAGVRRAILAARGTRRASGRPPRPLHR